MHSSECCNYDFVIVNIFSRHCDSKEKFFALSSEPLLFILYSRELAALNSMKSIG